MDDLHASTRPRFILLAMLVVLIGAFGALVLAPLLDHPRPHGPGRLDARLDIEVGTPDRAVGGTLRLLVHEANREPVVVALPAPAGDTGNQLAGALGELAQKLGVTNVRSEGASLEIDDVLRIGVDPGTTGAVVSLSVSTTGVEGASFRLGLDILGQAPETSQGVEVRLGIVASPAANTPSGADVQVVVELDGDPGQAMAKIAKVLMDQGWSVDHPTPAPDHLWIRALPSGEEPHALLLTVGVEHARPDQPPLVWTLGVE